mmetsp:Transcript_7663/g.34043  ORF Transcript_7663/g.34043 Transcript_7663/m.34043 type:complete len:139 (+) Transcript_7663:2249-2665(+)
MRRFAAEVSLPRGRGAPGRECLDASYEPRCRGKLFDRGAAWCGLSGRSGSPDVAGVDGLFQLLFCFAFFYEWLVHRSRNLVRTKYRKQTVFREKKQRRAKSLVFNQCPRLARAAFHRQRAALIFPTQGNPCRLLFVGL